MAQKGKTMKLSKSFVQIARGFLFAYVVATLFAIAVAVFMTVNYHVYVDTTWWIVGKAFLAMYALWGMLSAMILPMFYIFD